MHKIQEAFFYHSFLGGFSQNKSTALAFPNLTAPYKHIYDVCYVFDGSLK